MQTIGDNIKNLRVKAGLSQAELAEKLYITSQAISKWENNSSQPDINLLPDLASIFGVNIDDLFSYSDEKTYSKIENMIEIQNNMDNEAFIKAEKFLLEKLKSKADDYRANSLLGDLYIFYSANLRAKAVFYGKKAFDLNPNSIFDLNTINNASLGLRDDFSINNHKNLIDFYKKEIKKCGENTNLYEFLIKNLIDDGRFKEAKYYVNIAKSQTQDKIYEFYDLYIREKETSFNELSDSYLELASKYYDDSRIIYNIANRFSLNGKYENAISLWEKAFDCQAKPRYTDYHEAMALCYILMGDKDNAIKMYNAELELLKDEWNITYGYQVDKIKEKIEKLMNTYK